MLPNRVSPASFPPAFSFRRAAAPEMAVEGAGRIHSIAPLSGPGPRAYVYAALGSAHASAFTGGRSANAPRIRRPSGLDSAESLPPEEITEAQLEADRDTLGEIVAGLDRLEQRVERTRLLSAAVKRGYFTPDEEDRVRQALLAYRNYRLAAYEIIFRYREYDQLADGSRRLRCFMVAFGAALLLYAKSLLIIQAVERTPVVRAKFNEPEAKYDLPAGFFDDVVMGYSSLSNYKALIQGDRFWRQQRKTAFQLGLATEPAWAWLHHLICRKRRIVRRRLAHVLWLRLCWDWRGFWQTALRPARKTRYGLQTFLGGRFAGIHVVPNARPTLTPEMIGELRRQLQPGDVLLCRAETKLTAALLPGFWAHAAIFLGSRAELQALGESAGEPWESWGDIPECAGPLGLVIEAVSPRVRVSALETCLRADHVLVLRPNLPPAQICAAIREALCHTGKPYDFEFDFNCSTRVVCTELVYRSYHRRGGCIFPLVKRLGRFTLTGDDIIGFALDALGRAGGDFALAPLQPVALRLLRRDGQVHAVAADRIVPLLQRIRWGWRPARRITPSAKPAATS